MENCNGVYIPVDKFAEYVRKEQMLEQLLDAIYNGMALSYDKTYIFVSSNNDIAKYLRVVDGNRYRFVMNNLIKEKSEQESKEESNG